MRQKSRRAGTRLRPHLPSTSRNGYHFRCPGEILCRREDITTCPALLVRCSLQNAELSLRDEEVTKDIGLAEMATDGDKTRAKPSALRSVLAGATAGGIEIAITYPFEFAKTRSQLNRRLPDSEKLPWPRFPSKEWYAGCTTLIIGNSIKAGVRFVSFDAYKNLLADADGKVSGPRTVAAGFGAGITESILAVTPFESIKTQLIDDRKRAQPQMRGFLHGSGVIAREKGIRGFFQGFVPTTARQAANSAVRFSSYTWMKQMAESYVAPGEKLGTISTFGIGAMAGIITVYTTMPLDTVKTRMQSLEASKNYKNSFACAASIFKNEGILTYWSGALPRLGRLSLSGGITFTVYEKMMGLFNTLDPDRKII